MTKKPFHSMSDDADELATDDCGHELVISMFDQHVRCAECLKIIVDNGGSGPVTGPLSCDRPPEPVCHCNCCAEWEPKYDEARDLLVEAENIVGKMHSWLVVNSYNGELSHEARTLGEMAERFNHKYYECFPIKQDKEGK